MRRHICPSFRLSAGQVRLREIVTDAARYVDPRADWEDPQTLPVLDALRQRVLADPTVCEDCRTGIDLRTPSVPATYVAVQQELYPSRCVSEVEVAVEHLLFSHFDVGDPSMAAAGGDKWSTTYGAMTHWALGNAVHVAAEAAPKVLVGSSVISVGAGSNHRTLASYLWGEARLQYGSARVKLIEDELDPLLWRACERLEADASLDLRRFGITLDFDADEDENRRRVIALGERVEHDGRFAGALRARWSHKPRGRGNGIPDLRELEDLAVGADANARRRRWLPRISLG